MNKPVLDIIIKYTNGDEVKVGNITKIEITPAGKYGELNAGLVYYDSEGNKVYHDRDIESISMKSYPFKHITITENGEEKIIEVV